MAEPPVILEASGLARWFEVSPPFLERVLERRQRQWLKAVDGVDFRIRRGTTFALVGELGCGKSTVARLAVGLHAPSRGQIVFEGVDLATARRAELKRIRPRLQMIFQDPFASLNPRWRVRDIIAEPLQAHGIVAGGKAIRERVAELLAEVRLAPTDGERFPHEFSGGQRQRISIARALASKPDFLVCDEPTSALDVSVQAQILNLMKELQRELGLTYLFISHNLAVVYFIADEVGVMYLGRIVETAPVAELFARPRHPYTRLLLDTVPRIDGARDGAAREPVAGEVPSPLAPPPGCAFHPRCPFAAERCRRERPEPLPAGAARVACHGIEEGRIPVEERVLPAALAGADGSVLPT